MSSNGLNVVWKDTFTCDSLKLASYHGIQWGLHIVWKDTLHVVLQN